MVVDQSIGDLGARIAPTREQAHERLRMIALEDARLRMWWYRLRLEHLEAEYQRRTRVRLWLGISPWPFPSI